MLSILLFLLPLSKGCDFVHVCYKIGDMLNAQWCQRDVMHLYIFNLLSEARILPPPPFSYAGSCVLVHDSPVSEYFCLKRKTIVGLSCMEAVGQQHRATLGLSGSESDIQVQRAAAAVYIAKFRSG